MRFRAHGLHLPAGVFVVALLFTTAFNVVLPAPIRYGRTSDYTNYYEPVALSLLQGQGFTLNGNPATANPPGYSVITAALLSVSRATSVPEHIAFTMFNAVCTAWSALMLYVMSWRLFGKRLALWAAVAWITYPFALILTSGQLTEIPFMAVLFSGMAALWHGITVATKPEKWMALSGIMLGLSMLIRNAAILIVPVCVVIIWIVGGKTDARRRIVHSIILAVTSLLVILPWSWHLYAATGQVIVLGTNSAPSIRDGLTFAVGKEYRQELALPANVIALQERLLSRRDQMESASQIVTVLSDELARDPASLLALFSMKAIRAWYATDSGQLETFSLAVQGLYLTLIVVSIALLRSRRWPTRMHIVGVLLIVMYFWLQTISVLSILRYMVPAMGLLFTLLPVIPERLFPRPHPGKLP